MNLLDQKVFHLFGLPAAISIVPPAARKRFNESRQTISDSRDGRYAAQLPIIFPDGWIAKDVLRKARQPLQEIFAEANDSGSSRLY